MYAMVYTRPDLTYANSTVSQFMLNQGKQRWEAVKWVVYNIPFLEYVLRYIFKIFNHILSIFLSIYICFMIIYITAWY